MSIAATTALLVTLPLSTAHAASRKPAGFVYVMTNATANSVIQFSRGSDGQLTKVDEALTGGAGSSGTLDPLTSQDSLVLTAGGKLLLAVNAGSDEVSLLGANSSSLQLLTKVASGGDFPNSVARFEDLVYVLNAHGTPNISGFRLCVSCGTLTPVSGSTRALPGGVTAAPSDIHFNSDGTLLVVTENGTNQIDVFPIDAGGLAGDPVVQPSSGTGPFGFRIREDGVVAVAEAASASVSSYDLLDTGALTVISAHVLNGQAASCWISLTGDGSIGFVSNTGAGNLSSYRISTDGTVTLIQAAAASLAGGAPIDSALSRDSKFLYVIDSTGGRVVIFGVNGSQLTEIGAVTGLPTSIQGIGAR